MDVFKHYKDGTTHIDSNGDYHGYLPDRKERLLHIHIIHNDYDIYIYSDAITIHHKYISMVYEHSFKVGRWRYNINALGQYAYNEKKRLVEMDELLRELVNEHTLHGVHVSDYTAIVLINTHRTDTLPQ